MPFERADGWAIGRYCDRAMQMQRCEGLVYDCDGVVLKKKDWFFVALLTMAVFVDFQKTYREYSITYFT